MSDHDDEQDTTDGGGGGTNPSTAAEGDEIEGDGVEPMSAEDVESGRADTLGTGGP